MKNKLIILSLSPLFLLTFIGNLPWSKLNVVWDEGLSIKMILNHACLCIGLMLCLIWLIVSFCYYLNFKYYFKYDRRGGCTIANIKEEKNAGLNFFIALIIPLMTNKLQEINSSLSFLAIVIIIFILLRKTDIYYQNPILIVIGYRIYKFQFFENQDFGNNECIGISSNIISDLNTIEYKVVEDNVLIIRKMGG